MAMIVADAFLHRRRIHLTARIHGAFTPSSLV